MLPVPPRRKTPSLLAPRDVTETARQGQGIGDLEAMRQMATTAIPEVLRNAPVTSTPMSVFDIAKAVADRDLPAAGMAALGAIPFAGMLRYADEAAKAARALPMDEASRMARAAEQGFTRDVYHGSGTPVEFSTLRPSPEGLVGPLPYTTTSAAEAGEYAIGRAKRLGASGGAHVLPLKVRMQNPVIVNSVNEFRALGAGGDQSIIDALKKLGHDGIILRRGAGTSTGEPQDFVVPFETSQIRSRFAKFDPANIGKAGLMGGLAAMLGGAAMRQQPSQPDR